MYCSHPNQAQEYKKRTVTANRDVVLFLKFFFRAPKSISYFISTVSECDGGFIFNPRNNKIRQVNGQYG